MDRAAASSVAVSVVVPVWNVAPYLRPCLDSVVNQSIGLEHIELIAVDDGSTDESGAILDEYARRYPHLAVVHQPNSGGPGRPRNVGLDRAIGTYVFFLDGDDYLGPEALDRLVSMAERNTSDIVLGRVVAVGGRRLQTASFRKGADRADLERVYLSGSVQKLFRRSLIERLGLRFREGSARLEDGAFMARIYPEAKTISVVADYDCYFLRRRPGSQARVTDPEHDLAEQIAILERDQMEPVARLRRPGIGRDILMVKHIERLTRFFDQRWRSLEPEVRRRAFDVAAAVLQRRSTRLIQRVLPAWASIRTHCIQHGLFGELEDIVSSPPGVVFGDPIVDGRHIYARYPHFRDGTGIPDRYFDITHRVVAVQGVRSAALVDGRVELVGDAYLALVGGRATIEVCRWPWGRCRRIEPRVVATPELRDSVVRYPSAGFAASIDVSRPSSRPPPGVYSIHLTVGTERVHRTAPVRLPRGVTDRWVDGRSRAATASASLYVTPARELRLRLASPGRPTMWLERAEFAYVRVSRFVINLAVRLLTASHPGRMLELAIEQLRPGLAGRLIDER